ncbi:S1 family peptidase [Methylobacter sp.]
MAQKYVSPIELLIHSTVRIECETTTGKGSGSGYFFAFLEKENQHIPCIVTNKHVVAGAKRGVFHLTLQGQDGLPNLGEYVAFAFDNFEQMWIGHPDPSIDLAICLIGPILNSAKQQGKALHFAPLGNQLIASKELLDSLPSMEEIIMIGYPNGIWDAKHNLPIIRRGITATHPRLTYNGKPEFLIDAACFPGSSGSPVFLANIGSYVSPDGALCAGSRIALLGTLYAGPQHTATGEVVVVEVPTDTRAMAISTIPNNLGLVIHASKLLDFEPILEEITRGQFAPNA